MDKWEYMVIPEDTLRGTLEGPKATLDEQKIRLQNWLNEMGQESWELVAKGQHCLVFKRKLEQ